MYSYAAVPPKLEAMSNKQYMDLTVYVPAEAIDAYRNAEVWKNFWNLAPMSGIQDIENDDADESALPVHIYTVNGTEIINRDMNSLSKGIYIVRQGSKSRKIIVR